MDPELVALASAGGTALVGVMATDSWNAARRMVTRLFSRQGQDREAAIESQLDGNQALILGAEDPDQTRTYLAPLWEREFSTLLTAHPDAEADLRRLVDQLQAASKNRPAWTQINTARDNSRVFAAQGGNVVVHGTEPSQHERSSTDEPDAGR
ncbi:hypothetical protein [Embleya hyalina]|uniref:Uncharacterized protein n=1 Tax=Embleya hyalina TaxID=516124 RepID=A0A401YX10_9ACTN|nr:hypothetical protein [Embleya hyalina]GCD99138.1 hypothetical protein EHYA_06851 [Embleya hyalina]